MNFTYETSLGQRAGYFQGIQLIQSSNMMCEDGKRRWNPKRTHAFKPCALDALITEFNRERAAAQTKMNSFGVHLLDERESM